MYSFSTRCFILNEFRCSFLFLPEGIMVGFKPASLATAAAGSAFPQVNLLFLRFMSIKMAANH